MNINLTHNGKPLISPKTLIGLGLESSSLYFQLETNEDNINIIKDIKKNFINLTNSGAFIFYETKNTVYLFNTTKLYNQIKNSFIIGVVLMNSDTSVNEDFDDEYLFFIVDGFKQ